jgi:hypothetical protein
MVHLSDLAPVPRYHVRKSAYMSPKGLARKFNVLRVYLWIFCLYIRYILLSSCWTFGRQSRNNHDAKRAVKNLSCTALMSTRGVGNQLHTPLQLQTAVQHAIPQFV